MLNFMRQFASTIWGKILGGVLLVGLAGFGIQNVLMDLGTNTIAKVGDRDIPLQDFQRLYQAQLQDYAQKTGQTPTGDQAMSLGIPGSVLQQLAGFAALDQLAQKYGVSVSDTKLASMVRADPAFNGVLGTFDRSVFDQWLQQQGYTEASFLDYETQVGRREQMAIGLVEGSYIPATALDLVNRFRGETRTVEYFTLNQTSVADPGTPTDADLTAYLKDHQADFRTKETRTIDVVYLNPDILGAQFQPTDDEIKAEYDRTKAQLTTPEKRHIEQVVLTTPDVEKAFTDALAAGTSFTDAAAAAKVAPVDIGVLAKSEVSDGALADAAFGLPKAGSFAIIPGIAGKRAVGVTEIQPGGTTSLEDAKPDIAKRLAAAKAKAGYADLQDQIEELRAAFKPLKDIAARYKLPVETVALTQDGGELSAVPGLAEADRSKIAEGVFAATQGKLAPTVNYGSTSNAWFDLTKVDPARDQTLSEVHDAVATAWSNAKIDAELKAEVKSVTAELDAGKSLADVAAELKQFVTTSQPISRQGDPTSVLKQPVAEQIFSSAPGSHGSAQDADGEYLIYHVTDVGPPGPPDAQVTAFLTNSMRSTLADQLVSGLRDEFGIHVNQQALDQALNLDPTAQ